MGDRPVLWHIPVSHYSEKARWALDHKRFPHRRRVILPGGHMLVSGWLTQGRSKTFPVLDFGDRAIGDSSAIIAELERLSPERPLYPDDTDERNRALELEEFFDEELGPQIRLLMWHETRRDPTKACAGRTRGRVAPQDALAMARSAVCEEIATYGTKVR